MAAPPRRATVLLLVGLALAAIVFSSADAARAPKALLEGPQEAGATDGRQTQSPVDTGREDAVAVQHVVVVDKRGGFGGHGGGGEGEGSRGFGSAGYGYHGYGNGGRGAKSSASRGRSDGICKVGVAASVLGAAAWML